MRFLLSILATIASCNLFGEVTVVVQPGSDKAVRAAADAFAACHERVTGLRPGIDVKVEGEGPFVWISVDEKNFDGVTDAYRIRSCANGLELIGRNGRSAIYAVYDFFRIRCGAAYFWDGDVFVKSDSVDFSGLDVLEQSRFEYRGCQYFAHRGLTRFQAEHWGFADWKREIDWALKNRLNLVMLRIGIEDLFQLAYPEIVPYPDPDVTQPIDCREGYNYRTPFWSMQYRHLLRKAVIDYATDRGLMHPVEFGTMTHWFSRTPKEFREKMNPDPIMQEVKQYSEPSGEVWDVTQKKWFDAYWKLTEAATANYGYSGLLFNPGFDERVVYTNHTKNAHFKIDVINAFNREASRRYPDAKLLIEGWDFYFSWAPDEIKDYLKTADSSRTLIFDFTADEDGTHIYDWVPKHNNFSEWGLVGKFPYVFGWMLELNKGNDIRGNYAKIRAREDIVRDDQMCKGYVLWPEASHTDIFAWRYFTDSCWKLSEKSTDERLVDFCRDRYGDQADLFLKIWRSVVSFSHKAGWANNFPEWLEVSWKSRRNAEWKGAVQDLGSRQTSVPARDVFAALAQVDWTGEFVRRDAIDLARTTLDRELCNVYSDLMASWCAVKSGSKGVGCLKVEADRFVRLVDLFADLLALHTDFSLTETYARMNAVEKIRNPRGEHLLFENAACEYCRSHHAEWARAWYLPWAREIAELLVERGGKGDFSSLPELTDVRAKLRASEHPIFAFAPDTEKRTKGDYLKVIENLSEVMK